MKENKLTTISPKCLQNLGKAFIGATGELWPCCWLYTDREHMEDWALRNDCDIEELSLKKYTILEVQKSNLMQKTTTCHKRPATNDTNDLHKRLPQTTYTNDSS